MVKSIQPHRPLFLNRALHFYHRTHPVLMRTLLSMTKNAGLLLKTYDPGIQYIYSTALIVCSVAGCHTGTKRSGYRGDLAIRLADGATNTATLGSDRSEGKSCLAVKGQDSVMKILF
jgi:hypothetical protein